MQQTYITIWHQKARLYRPILRHRRIKILENAQVEVLQISEENLK